METPPPSSEPPSPRKPGGLWGRLRGAFQAMAAPPTAEPAPTWDTSQPTPPAAQFAADVPMASPVPEEEQVTVPIAPAVPLAEPESASPPAAPAESPAAVIANPEAPAEPPGLPDTTDDLLLPPLAALTPCPACQAPRSAAASFCIECGFLFPAEPPQPEPAASEAQPAGRRLLDRYEVQDVLSRQGKVTRLRALDHGAVAGPVPVILVRMANVADLAKLLPPTTPNIPHPLTAAGDEANSSAPPPDDEAVTGADAPKAETATISVFDFGPFMNWPALGWEWALLDRCRHSGLPRVVHNFVDGDDCYLVEEAFTGRSLWDAWDDPTTTSVERFAWLTEVAEALQELHHAGAILEGLRPESVVIKADGHAAIADLSDLLPLPLPADPPIKATPYTAPELILASKTADARADLYSFGAMLYALSFGRELTELDFERQGVPKPFVLQFPDSHPLVGRILMKTFVREPDMRFPTDEASREDATGFTELIQTLRLAAETVARVRLDVAGWTSTGLLRTSNEDAFAIVHTCGGRANQLDDTALVILADGMGGEEAGEVAAAMALDGLRQRLLPAVVPEIAGIQSVGSKPGDLDHKSVQVTVIEETICSAICEVNREIYDAARTPGRGRRGMGCTVEAVFLDGRHAVIGHVGDSRTYHYRSGSLTQITRDQTLVNRLVELGQLTAEEAENHPRKNELQQALGGVPQIEPQTAQTNLQPGDWLVVCSDGLTNHVDDDTLSEVIQRADSAETLARRLVNLANLNGGSDNCTVVAVRVT